MVRFFARFAALILMAAPVALSAQALPEGQGKPEFDSWLARDPGARGLILSFEAWQDAAGVANVLPSWQVTRTASSWRACSGPPFEVPPPSFWPDMTRTLAFIRDYVAPALGGVEAVSGFRNPSLNVCAKGSPNSAHLDYFALDLVPLRPYERRELYRVLCDLHARHGRRFGVGLGFYAFQRFHIDTKGFRRWGAAGPNNNESPCALIERGEDPTPPDVQPVAGAITPPVQGGSSSPRP